jgi:hypothetical protein
MRCWVFTSLRNFCNANATILSVVVAGWRASHFRRFFMGSTTIPKGGVSSQSKTYELDTGAAMKQVEKDTKKWKEIEKQVNKPIDFLEGKNSYEDAKPDAGKKKQKKDPSEVEIGPFKCKPTGKTTGKCKIDF